MQRLRKVEKAIFSVFQKDLYQVYFYADIILQVTNVIFLIHPLGGFSYLMLMLETGYPEIYAGLKT